MSFLLLGHGPPQGLHSATLLGCRPSWLLRLQWCEAGKCGRVAGCEGGASCLLPLMPRLCVADVDECVTGTHNCQAGFSCQNTKGSFYCQARQRCMDGFLQDPEGNCVGKQASGCGSSGPACFRALVGLTGCPLLQPQCVYPLSGYVQNDSCSAHLGALSLSLSLSTCGTKLKDYRSCVLIYKELSGIQYHRVPD